MSKVTSKQIQITLHEILEREKKHRPVVPNSYLPDWWEADIASVTKAGLLWEFEIKLTRADFRKDALKSRTVGPWRDRSRVTKYEQLEAGIGPSRFVYVVPAGIIKLEDLPKCAGLWEYKVTEWGRKYFAEVKAPPPLHRRKLEPKQIQAMYRVFYYRYWSLLKKHGNNS